MNQLDLQLLLWINHQLVNPILDGIMLTATLLGYPEFLVLVPLPLLRRPRYRREGIALIGAIALAALLAVRLQLIFLRPRPVGTRLLLALPAYPSFPSGHASSAFAGATLVALIWPRYRVPAWIGAALIAFSRLYLGVHYPADILGGALLGSAIGGLIYAFIYLPRSAEISRQGWLIWAQLVLLLLGILSADLELLIFSWLHWPGVLAALHFLIFGSLAFSLVSWRSGRSVWPWIIGLILLASLEEWRQTFLPNRHPDWGEFLASLTGILLLGGWANLLWKKRALPEK